MTNNRHPVDDALRKVAGDPRFTESDIAQARAKLDAAIAAETETPPLRRRYRLVAWTAVVLLLTVGLVVLIDVLRPSTTVAAIEEIARVAEAADLLTVPDDQFIHTRSEITAIHVIPKEGLGDVPYDKDQLVYLLTTLRESWLGSDGTVQLRTTNLPPQFFDPADEKVYHQAGLDRQDAMGETVTQTVTDPGGHEQWPSQQQQLDEAIWAVLRTDRGLPETVEYLDVALDILRETFASPELRASTLRLIAGLADLEMISSSDESVTFAIDYTDQGKATRLSFTLSIQGHLLSEQQLLLDGDERFGIPSDTVVFSAHYSVPTAVESLP